MYELFSIDNFRLFDKFRLDDLARINLITGMNNTGKTALLEALLMSSSNTPELVLQLNWLRGLETFTVDYWRIGGKAPWISLFRGLDLDHLTARHRASEKDAGLLSGLIRAGREEILLDALRKVDPRIEQILILIEGERPLIHVRLRGLAELLPLALLGDGIQRLASFILGLSQCQDGALLIDEIENGLHHSVLETVWRALGEAAHEFNAQIFATTYSYECILAAEAAFGNDRPDELRLYRLDRGADGRIKAVTYNQALLDAAIAENFEVR